MLECLSEHKIYIQYIEYSIKYSIKSNTPDAHTDMAISIIMDSLYLGIVLYDTIKVTYFK